MAWTKGAIVHAKAAKRGVVEQPAGRGKKRQAKPVVVEYRYPFMKEWGLFGCYADIETAQAVIAIKTRAAHCAEYRIKP